jgi:TPR repeat protein
MTVLMLLQITQMMKLWLLGRLHDDASTSQAKRRNDEPSTTLFSRASESLDVQHFSLPFVRYHRLQLNHRESFARWKKSHLFEFEADSQQTQTQLFCSAMSLEHIVPVAELERQGYHLLPQRQLETLADAEALYERARRLRNGEGIREDSKSAWAFTYKSAQLGHPLALADCYRFGHETAKNPDKAAHYYRASAERGHPAGMLRSCLLVSLREKQEFRLLGFAFTWVSGLRRTSKKLFDCTA